MVEAMRLLESRPAHRWSLNELADEPIAQIGRTVDWADQNYFARRFKAHYGLSATAYRRRFTHNSVWL